MDVSKSVKTIDKFLKDNNIRSKKEIGPKGEIIITGVCNVVRKEKYSEQSQVIFTIDKETGITTIKLTLSKIYLEIKELAKEINGCVWMGGRMVDDFRPLHSVPDLKETIVPPSIKSEMDPHNIESDNGF